MRLPGFLSLLLQALWWMKLDLWGGRGVFRLRAGEDFSPAGEVLSSDGKYPKITGAEAPDPWGAIRKGSLAKS